MSHQKRRVLVLFGGRSGEHEVSIVSATHVKQALDPARYEIKLIGITKEGRWVNVPAGLPLTVLDDATRRLTPALLSPGPATTTDGSLGAERVAVDVVLPVLHGPYGEDGTIQGFLELTGLPYVGCGVLASAVAMDKVTAKRLFREAGIPVTDWVLVNHAEFSSQPDQVRETITERFPFPLFVKPVNLGSSVGVSKATDPEQLTRALAHAFEFDRRVLVEPAVHPAREIEVAVLGNDQPRVSVPGEIVPDREFYDYESKYDADSTSEAMIPARLDRLITKQIQDVARLAFTLIDGAGMARVDFLVNGDTGQIFLNEVNTIPGFTPISMYPKLWEASGVSYRELLDTLINLAFERSAQKQSLRTSRS